MNKKINADKLKKTLESHRKYLETGGVRGKRANLSGADLIGSDLSGADLSGADLSGANLRGANLSGADLSGANLIEANLRYSNLSGADLSGANLSGANFIDSDLNGVETQYGVLTQPVMILSLIYWVLISELHIQVGCQQFSHDEFLNLTESDAKKLDGRKAVEFYKTYRSLVVAAIESFKK